MDRPLVNVSYVKTGAQRSAGPLCGTHVGREAVAVPARPEDAGVDRDVGGEGDVRRVEVGLCARRVLKEAKEVEEEEQEQEQEETGTSPLSVNHKLSPISRVRLGQPRDSRA